MGEMIKLRDGRTAPLLAFGTAGISSEEMGEVLKEALDTGYRCIDTAHYYGNEQAIGDVLQERFSQGKLQREEVFVTTKLWGTLMGREDVRGAVEGSLHRLQLTYLDLMLIHCPWGFKNRGDGTMFPKDEHGNAELQNYDLVETWKALEELVSEGKIRSLGISNFNSVQTERICSAAAVRPVLNQVECHAYLPQKELQEFSEGRGVYIQAYAPLGSPGRRWKKDDEPVLLEEPVLKAIGDQYSKSPAQVLIRSLLQRGIMVVVKSVTPSQIRENFQVFDFALSAEDMANIDKLRNDCRLFRHLFEYAKDHPEYPFNIPF